MGTVRKTKAQIAAGHFTNDSEYVREAEARFEVQPHDFSFKPGVDTDRLNQLADELEVEELAGKLRR